MGERSDYLAQRDSANYEKNREQIFKVIRNALFFESQSRRSLLNSITNFTPEEVTMAIQEMLMRKIIKKVGKEKSARDEVYTLV